MIDEAAVTLTRWATTARTLLAQLRLAGSTGSDDDAEPADDCEVVQPLGLRVRPVDPTPGQPSTLEAFCVERGDETIALFLVDKARATGAVEPEAGGTTLHSLAAQSAVVYLRASGDVEVTAAPGRNVVITGQVVQFQDGTQPFLRGNDFATAVSVFTTALGNFTAGLTVLNALLVTFANTAVTAPPAASGPALAAGVGVFAPLVTALQTAAAAFDTQTTAAKSTKVTGQ